MKSFIVSAILTLVLAFFFMSVLDTKTSEWYRKFPDWIFIAMVGLIFSGYVLCLYWAISGLKKGSAFLNVLGILISVVGIGLYALFFFMDKSSGKEKKGQFDHELPAIETTQHKALDDLLSATGTKPTDVKIVAYWKMNKNPDDFVICIQKGNIIALQVKNKPINDLNTVSKLSYLNWLVLENCGLKSVSDLNLPALQRLSIKQNQISSLAGLEHSPQLGWLNYYQNPVTDSGVLSKFNNQQLYIINE